MAAVQFGLVLPVEFRSDDSCVTFLADAERALQLVSGTFDSGWVVDHLQSGEVRRLEAFTTLSYLAALHPGFMFGHAVLCQSFRNPALLAKMAATLQVLTRGRFILGLGAGSDEEEHLAYGYAFPSGAERVARLAETIEIVKALWAEPVASFEGRYLRVKSARCLPRPEPAPPIMIGAFRPQMLRLVAQHADWWNVSSTGPRRYARMASELERACFDVGRDPATVRRTWIGGFACAETQGAAEALAGEGFSSANEDDYGFTGTPRQVIGQMRALMDLGVDYFMLDAADFPNLGCLRVFVEEVLPALRG